MQKMPLDEFLKALGDEPENVAKTLRWLGIKGKRHSSCHCPIANLVERYTGTRPYVYGLPNAIRWQPVQSQWSSVVGPQDPHTPLAVSWFAGRFDQGQYSNLVE